MLCSSFIVTHSYLTIIVIASILLIGCFLSRDYFYQSECHISEYSTVKYFVVFGSVTEIKEH